MADLPPDDLSEPLRQFGVKEGFDPNDVPVLDLEHAHPMWDPKVVLTSHLDRDRRPAIRPHRPMPDPGQIASRRLAEELRDLPAANKRGLRRHPKRRVLA
jgi:hypothetical protein